MDIVYIDRNDPGFPPELRKYPSEQTPKRISVLGNLDILKQKKTAFFCSSKCPGDLIFKARDLSRKWLDDGVPVISGFHSPVEKECLTILLRGRQPVIICPARSIETMRIRAEFKTPLAEGRLLFLSPLPAREKRMTARTAAIRNRFAAAMADEVFIAHAAGSGKIEALSRELAARLKPLLTFASDANANLLALGVKPIAL